MVLPQSDGGEERLPLRLVGATLPGYWGADGELAAGTPYGYSIDGGDLLTDPRSVWLPDGIHGPTRVFDPAFDWSDDEWTPPDLGSGVVLRLDVATFTREGTLDAATRHLRSVADLGIQGVELSPVCAFDPDEGAAKGVRLYSVHEPYGGPRALQRFVDTAHAAGLAVVLDIPYRWAAAAGVGLDVFGPYAVGSPSPVRSRSRGGTYRPGAGPASDRVAAMRPRTGQIPLVRPRTGQIPVVSGRGTTPSAPTFRTDGGSHAAPRFNLDGSGSRGVRDFLLDDAKHWFREYHVDGLVLDVEALTDRAQIPFLGELADTVVSMGEERQRRFALLVDGPGRSDRLATVVHRMLTAPGDPRDIDDLRLLADQVHPSVRRAVRQAPAARRTQRSDRRAGATVVENITRLPGAVHTTPWADHDGDRPLLDLEDLDSRASLLACSVLAGTPLVLDTRHVPVVARTDRDRRLAAWAHHLLKLRHDTSDEMDLPMEIRASADNTVVAALRGKGALIVNAGSGLAAVRLRTLLRPAENDLQAPAPAAFRLIAAWEPGATRLVGDTLTIPPRMAAVLRAD